MITEQQFTNIAAHIFKRDEIIKAVKECYFKNSSIKEAEQKYKLAKNTLRRSFLRFQSELEYLNSVSSN